MGCLQKQLKIMFKKVIDKTCDSLKNIFSKDKLAYVVEDRSWAVGYVGLKIVSELNRAGLICAKIATTPLGLRGKIVHFGSVNTFLRESGFKKIHQSNKAVATWFHFIPQDQRNKYIFEAQKTISFLHTSCFLTKKKLLEFGVKEEKIKVIPLGIDLNIFKPALQGEKQALRNKLGIPEGAVVAGSFQKDGVGWGCGFEAKLIKGPDIFVKSIEKLKKDFPVFALLVGPSRGYIKKELSARSIPYKHIGFLETTEEVAQYYQALDLYLVTSRIEGGPQSILESMASGVPLVSTKVGMAQDVIQEGQNGFLAEVENIDEIVKKSGMILSNNALKTQIISNALVAARNYSWDKIASRYFTELYLPLAKKS